MNNQDISLPTDVFLKLLQFGQKNGLDGVSYEDLFEFGRDVGYFSETELNELKSENPHAWIPESVAHKKKWNLISIFEESYRKAGLPEDNLVLSVDSYFKLLEHEELVLARENAKSARQFSIAAIAISFISLLVALYFSNQPIRVADKQYEGIVRQFETQAEKLNVLIERAEKIKSAFPHTQKK